MMWNDNGTLKIRYDICKEVFQTATKLYGLDVLTWGVNNSKRYENWMGEKPKFSVKFYTWGKVVVVKTYTQSKPNIFEQYP